LDETWIPQHVIVGLFEGQKTSNNAMALQLYGLLGKFRLIHFAPCFVKTMGKILGSMATTMQSIVHCKFLKIL
jgi:hypothetical protein